MRRALLPLMGAIALTAALPSLSLAHGGGLDRNGGHHDRRNGGYHCHREPCFSQQRERERRDELTQEPTTHGTATSTLRPSPSLPLCLSQQFVPDEGVITRCMAVNTPATAMLLRNAARREVLFLVLDGSPNLLFLMVAGAEGECMGANLIVAGRTHLPRLTERRDIFTATFLNAEQLLLTLARGATPVDVVGCGATGDAARIQHPDRLRAWAIHVLQRAVRDAEERELESLIEEEEEE